MKCLTTNERDEWQEILGQSYQHDWYHLADTHRLAERNGEGTGYLFVYREGPHFIAMPLLVRPLGTVPELQSAAPGWNDATSVYGYVGPVASHECIPEPVARNFRSELSGMLREMRVVSVFSRLHPLIPQRALLQELGELTPSGQTISIDMSISPDAQFKQYAKGHRQDINRARSHGLVCVEDRERVYMDSLISLYDESMRRLNAGRYYFFDRSYFEGLFNLSGCDARLFVVLYENQAVHANVVMICDGILQGHLSGTLGSATKLAPMKLCIDTVRQWAVKEGLKHYHFGGGLGGREDSLFHFKAGFSSTRNEFLTWRLVLDPEAYSELCQARVRGVPERGAVPASDGFFPAYRAPIIPPQGIRSDPPRTDD